MKGNTDFIKLSGIIVMFVIIAIIGAVGLDVISDLEDSGIYRYRYANDSLTITNGTNHTIRWLEGGLIITNATDLLGSGNYTTVVDPTGSHNIIIPAISSCCNDTASWNHYYQWKSAEITDNSSASIVNITERFGLLGTLFVFAIVLAMIIAYLKFRQ